MADAIKPVMSIITVVFNNADTIAHCLESVNSQSLPVEHIIIDGGSTDGTLQVIERFRPKLARFVSEFDHGIYDAMNKGIALATGDVIGILNSDDCYVSANVIEKISEIFKDERIDSCYADLVYVDPLDKSKIIRRWKSGLYDERSFYWGWMPPHPTFFVRRSVYEKYGLFKTDIGTAADYELMLRFLLKHKITTAYIPEVLVIMQDGGISNSSLLKRIKANRMDLSAWHVNGLKPYPWTIFFKPLRKMGQFLVLNRLSSIRKAIQAKI
jgi:glycosyltransferase involved in cell wall biosynthesis